MLRSVVQNVLHERHHLWRRPSGLSRLLGIRMDQRIVLQPFVGVTVKRQAVEGHLANRRNGAFRTGLARAIGNVVAPFFFVCGILFGRFFPLHDGTYTPAVELTLQLLVRPSLYIGLAHREGEGNLGICEWGPLYKILEGIGRIRGGPQRLDFGRNVDVRGYSDFVDRLLRFWVKHTFAVLLHMLQLFELGHETGSHFFNRRFCRK